MLAHWCARGTLDEGTTRGPGAAYGTCVAEASVSALITAPRWLRLCKRSEKRAPHGNARAQVHSL